MTEKEKLEQARALYDAGLFKRKIIDRTPEDVYSDTVTLECGHTTSISRGSEDTKWDCRDCRRKFEPDPYRKIRRRANFAMLLPIVFLVIYFALMLPGWIQAGKEKEAAEATKQRELQDIKDRLTRIEEQLKNR